jgi:hypothetical protein
VVNRDQTGADRATRERRRRTRSVVLALALAALAALFFVMTMVRLGGGVAGRQF